eukprot:gene2569-3285_t
MATDTCEYDRLPEGTSCDSEDPLTKDGACQAGSCLGVPLCEGVVCPASGGCASSICDPATGTCVPSPVPAGEACNDGDPYTTGDSCSPEGLCTGTPLCAGVECAPEGPCQESSRCETRPDGTAGCVPTPAADGTWCGTGSVVEVCQGGDCVLIGHVTSAAVDPLVEGTSPAVSFAGTGLSDGDLGFFSADAACQQPLSRVYPVVVGSGGSAGRFNVASDDLFLQSPSAGYLCYRLGKDHLARLVKPDAMSVMPNSACSGHGSGTLSQCVCEDGWHGPDCATICDASVCSGLCDDQGLCIGSCTGEPCVEGARPCNEPHGTRTVNAAGVLACVCSPGYHGADCTAFCSNVPPTANCDGPCNAQTGICEGTCILPGSCVSPLCDSANCAVCNSGGKCAQCRLLPALRTSDDRCPFSSAGYTLGNGSCSQVDAVSASQDYDFPWWVLILLAVLLLLCCSCCCCLLILLLLAALAWRKKRQHRDEQQELPLDTLPPHQQPERYSPQLMGSLPYEDAEPVPEYAPAQYYSPHPPDYSPSAPIYSNYPPVDEFGVTS